MDSAFSGIVFVDKPAGITSFQVLFPLKRIFHTKRVGHAGSLDLRASGLVIAAIGRATRLLPYIEAEEKSYAFRIILGYTTDTLEWDGDLVSQGSPDKVPTLAELEAVLPQFRGPIQQIPPQYSAVKVGGHRASDLMLRGREFDLQPRPIQIHRLEVKGEAPFPEKCTGKPVIAFDMECDCSKGTYIRSLCRDIAQTLGTYGCVYGIRRHRIGKFPVTSADAPDKITEASIRTPQSVLPFPVAKLSIPELAQLREGRYLPWQERLEFAAGEEPLVFASDEAGEPQFLCAYQRGRLLPKCFLGAGE